MGVTTGELSGDESQLITITVPGTLNSDQAEVLSAALNKAIDDFNRKNSGRRGQSPTLTVES
jgi:hypothetical protein